MTIEIKDIQAFKHLLLQHPDQYPELVENQKNIARLNKDLKAARILAENYRTLLRESLEILDSLTKERDKFVSIQIGLLMEEAKRIVLREEVEEKKDA